MSAFQRNQIEAALALRIGPAYKKQQTPEREKLPSGIPQVDAITGGLPTGAITEIFGPASSGRTGFLFSALREATRRQEVCALIDANDTLDPISAQAAEIDLERLLWVRCAGNLEHALRVTDLLLQGGGFGLLALDLGNTSAEKARAIPMTYWFRFRRAVETSPAVFLIIGTEACAGTCATLVLRTNKSNVVWAGGMDARLLCRMSFRVERQKPQASTCRGVGKSARLPPSALPGDRAK